MRVKEKTHHDYYNRSDIIFNFKQRAREASPSPKKRASSRLMGRYDWDIMKHFSLNALDALKGWVRKAKDKIKGPHLNNNTSVTSSEMGLRNCPININDLLSSGVEQAKRKKEMAMKAVHFWKRNVDTTHKVIRHSHFSHKDAVSRKLSKK